MSGEPGVIRFTVSRVFGTYALHLRTQLLKLLELERQATRSVARRHRGVNITAITWKKSFCDAPMSAQYFSPRSCEYMRILTVSWRISTSFTRFSSAERPLGAWVGSGGREWIASGRDECKSLPLLRQGECSGSSGGECDHLLGGHATCAQRHVRHCWSQALWLKALLTPLHPPFH